MAILPPSTNNDYRGSPLSAWFVVLTGVMSIIPGLIHYFLPDGGAGVIAHMDLSTRAETIFVLFAWFGALQIPHGIGQLIIGLRYRTLVPLMLVLVIIERGLMALDGWFLKGAGGHHPPEHYASPVAVVLSLIFLILSLRERRA
ncbi:MAG: hypothetical protein RJA87_985 [Pseudomonadota bacterium]|jgi:hypothetical protein